MSLFPEMDEDAEFDAVATAIENEFRRYLRRRMAEDGKDRQRLLLSGLDCLAGQKDLFATDGERD